MSSLLADELTVVQPSLQCFTLAPSVLNHHLENTNTPTEGSTSVPSGLRPVVQSVLLTEKGRCGVMTCQVDQAKVYRLVVTTHSLSWPLRRCAGPHSSGEGRDTWFKEPVRT